MVDTGGETPLKAPAPHSPDTPVCQGVGVTPTGLSVGKINFLSYRWREKGRPGNAHRVYLSRHRFLRSHCEGKFLSPPPAGTHTGVDGNGGEPTPPPQGPRCGFDVLFFPLLLFLSRGIC